jgi:hypothetical protein
MADIHGSPADPGLQMPQLASSGPAAVPYPGGRDQAAANPPVYEAAPLDMAPADGYVLHGVTGLNTAQDPSAYDVNGNPGPSPLATPYYAGQQAPLHVHGDPDAGSASNIAPTVGDSVAMATGRWQELQSDTFTPGPVAGTVVQNEPNLSDAGHPQQQASVIGDLIDFPPSPLDPGAGVGNTAPVAGFYDPDRDYGGTQGAPGYQGKAL